MYGIRRRFRRRRNGRKEQARSDIKWIALQKHSSEHCFQYSCHILPPFFLNDDIIPNSLIRNSRMLPESARASASRRGAAGTVGLHRTQCWFLSGVPAPLPGAARKGLRALPCKVLGFGPRHDGEAPSLRKLQLDDGCHWAHPPMSKINLRLRSPPRAQTEKGNNM